MRELAHSRWTGTTWKSCQRRRSTSMAFNSLSIAMFVKPLMRADDLNPLVDGYSLLFSGHRWKRHVDRGSVRGWPYPLNVYIQMNPKPQISFERKLTGTKLRTDHTGRRSVTYQTSGTGPSHRWLFPTCVGQHQPSPTRAMRVFI